MLSHFPAYATPTSTLAPTDAKLTEAHGDVYKRTFVDWTKEALGDPSPASVGEILNEGMQIGTGEKSWAQLQWRHMSARAWANSVYAIAPNQRLVYLVSGEMLYQLDKNRGEKSPYFVWTNLLQARIRGTTVLFQATKTVSRITVLEGTVEVLNKIDHSVVTITPGVVYEISTKDGVAPQTSEALTNISLASSVATPIFETSRERSTASVIDPMAIMNHPLLREFESPLPSLPLVTDAISSIQSRIENAGKNLLPVISSVLKDSLTITSVPRKLSYTIGSELNDIAQLAPGSFDFFQPEGVIGKPGLGITNTLMNPIVSPANLNTTGLVPSNITGNLQSVSTTTAAATSTLGGISTLTNGTAGTIGSVLNTATATTRGVLTGLAPTTTGLTNTLGTTTSGLTNTVTNTLNNTLSGLGGLLGH
jgi:hypothetical protein